MKTIWLACCACGDYGLLQREVEGRDPGAQVLRVGDLDGLLSMARAFPSRRGAAIILARTYGPDAVRETVARLAAEGRCARTVVLVEDLDPATIEGLFRAGATEVVAARRVIGRDGDAADTAEEGACALGAADEREATGAFDAPAAVPDALNVPDAPATEDFSPDPDAAAALAVEPDRGVSCPFLENECGARNGAPLGYADKRAGETVVPSGRPMPADDCAPNGMGPGAPRATGGPRDRYVAVTEHERRTWDPYGACRRACAQEGPAAGAAWAPPTPPDDGDALGYVHGVNILDELDEAAGYGGVAEGYGTGPGDYGTVPSAGPAPDAAYRPQVDTAPAGVTGDLAAAAAAWASPAAPATTGSPSAAPGPRAPLVSVISGSGGCGKSTIVAAMAQAASLLGLRAAVLDLDLMFGNLYDLLGVEQACDMATLIEPAAAGALPEAAVVGAAMRVAPGITLWGPVAAPERAESMARAVELLIDVLRRESDVIFVDTSVFWGDAVAAAVAASDRCLVVGDMAVSSATAAARAIDLACRVGVPRTACTAVFNRFGARGADEDTAMRFELTCALSSKIRIADGGQDLAALMAFGRADEAVGQTGAFATSVREATREMLVELGCAVGPWSDTAVDRATRTERPRIRLPWKRTEVAR